VRNRGQGNAWWRIGHEKEGLLALFFVEKETFYFGMKPDV
jgi:hypothetical protein